MNRRRRKGIVLVLVLVMIAIMAISCLGFSDLMMTERKAVELLGRRIQARASAEAGVELARQFLSQDPSLQNEEGGCYDNPQQFANVVVANSELPRDRGLFTLVAPRIIDHASAEIRNGLEDESTRINLQTILQADQQGSGNAHKMLMALPGMTDVIADSILDWIDSDDTTRGQGAEADYYSALTPAYAPRNGPPATIEELLLVRDMSPQLLFGLDAIRVTGDTTNSSDSGWENVDNSDGSMDHGWAAYLTLYSMESNLRQNGSPKINLNSNNLQKLYNDLETALGSDWARFIILYRQNGPSSGTTGGNVASTGQLDFSKKPVANFSSVLDLVGTRTSVTTTSVDGKSTTQVVNSPCSEDNAAMSNYLPKLLDNTSVSANPIPGRININQASRYVLSGIPGMTPDAVEKIIAKRVADPTVLPPEHNYETWILTEGIVSLATMKTLIPYVNTGGCVFRVHSVGFFEGGGPTAQVEVLLDASQQPAGILFWRDVSHFGIGYNPDTIQTTDK